MIIQEITLESKKTYDYKSYPTDGIFKVLDIYNSSIFVFVSIKLEFVLYLIDGINETKFSILTELESYFINNRVTQQVKNKPTVVSNNENITEDLLLKTVAIITNNIKYTDLKY